MAERPLSSKPRSMLTQQSPHQSQFAPLQAVSEGQVVQVQGHAAVMVPSAQGDQGIAMFRDMWPPCSPNTVGKELLPARRLS